MDPELIPIDEAELKRLTAALRATSYHEHLERYVRERIAYLLDDTVTDPYVAMKRRGQVEELQRLVVPLFVKSLALSALARRAEARATLEEARAELPRRDWWSDPAVEEYPVS